MINEEKCKHHDKENGWCKKLSDWSDPMPYIVYCPKSPCEYAEPIEQPMTDNDIIKALGFCESPTCECTSECPMYHNRTNSKSNCRGELHKNALRLINRLKSEIDILCSSLSVSSQNFENMARAMPNIAKATRIEAIKVFTEKTDKIITEIYNKFIFGDYDLGDEAREAIMDFSADISRGIDNLVKEMTEDNDA